MKFSNTALGLIVAAFGIAVLLHVRTFPEMAGMEYGPEFFPGLIGAAFVLIGAGLVVSGLASAAARRVAFVALPPWSRDGMAVARAVGVIAAVVLYALLAPFLGFLITTIVLTAGLLALMGVRVLVLAPIAVLLPFALHYVFSITLRVPLPRGPLERLLF